MKFPKPFFRKSKGAWYVQLGKRQISLGKDREEAFRRYRELLLHEQGKSPERTGPLTAAQVCDLFLEWSKKHNEQKTYEWYLAFLQGFCDLHGGRKAEELIPFHVTTWLDSEKGWGEATRRCATVAGTATTATPPQPPADQWLCRPPARIGRSACSPGVGARTVSPDA